jgi:hypothetical protein
MGHRLPTPEYSMEVQARLRQVRRDASPLYERALATGNYAFLQEVNALAGLIRTAETVAKRVTQFAESACADGIAEPGHGRAA